MSVRVIMNSVSFSGWRIHITQPWPAEDDELLQTQNKGLLAIILTSLQWRQSLNAPILQSTYKAGLGGSFPAK